MPQRKMKDDQRKAMFANLGKPQMRTGRTRKNPESVKAKRNRSTMKKRKTFANLRTYQVQLHDAIRLREKDLIASANKAMSANNLDKWSEDSIASINARTARLKVIQNLPENLTVDEKTEIIKTLKTKSLDVPASSRRKVDILEELRQ